MSGTLNQPSGRGAGAFAENGSLIYEGAARRAPLRRDPRPNPILEQQQGRLLKDIAQRGEERRADGAVDDPVVARQRE